MYCIAIHKAVVAGPAGRRAPDHFLGRVWFLACPFFWFQLILHFTSDFIQSATIIDVIINNARYTCHQ